MASQQAAFLVRALKARIRGQSLPMFKFSDKGSLVSPQSIQSGGRATGPSQCARRAGKNHVCFFISTPSGHLTWLYPSWADDRKRPDE